MGKRAPSRATQSIVNEKMNTLKETISKGKERHERIFGYIHNCFNDEKLNSGYKQTRKDIQTKGFLNEQKY